MVEKMDDELISGYRGTSYVEVTDFAWGLKLKARERAFIRKSCS
jgi:hypothetical protein